MTTALRALEQIRATNSTTSKLSILRECAGDSTLRRILHMAYDTVVFTYGVSLDRVRAFEDAHAEVDKTSRPIEMDVALDRLEKLCSPMVSGKRALVWAKATIDTATSAEVVAVLEGILDRDLKLGMGKTQINKVFGGLIVKPPYMRCQPFTRKAAGRIHFPALLQLKADGAYRSVVVDRGSVHVCSRTGESCDSTTLLSVFRSLPDGVYIGEMLVDGISNRSESNGLLNSTHPPEDRMYMQLWDVVSHAEWIGTTPSPPYAERWRVLETLVGSVQSSAVQLIPCVVVDSVDAALRQTATWMGRGFEGGVLKDRDNQFKDHASPTQLKLKLKMDADMRVTGFVEGKRGTKRARTFGAMTFANDEGTIRGQCAGFTDRQLVDYNGRREELVGRIVTVQFNDLSKAQKHSHHALVHPRFVGLRDDKSTTDTLDRVQKIRRTAVEMGC